MCFVMLDHVIVDKLYFHSCSDDSESHDHQSGSHDSSSDEEEETMEVTDGRHDNQWDCESVLSTYSNLYNHPVTINDPVGVC